MAILTKKAVPVTRRGTTDASTYQRRQEGKHVWYDAPRSSKARPGEPDHYTLPVDEDLCIVLGCNCWDRVNVQMALGSPCKHMSALEARLVAEKAQRMTSFTPTHRLQFGTGKKRNWWRVQVVNVQLDAEENPYFDVVISPKNKSGRHFLYMVPGARLKPLPRKRKKKTLSHT